MFLNQTRRRCAVPLFIVALLLNAGTSWSAGGCCSHDPDGAGAFSSHDISRGALDSPETPGDPWQDRAGDGDLCGCSFCHGAAGMSALSTVDGPSRCYFPVPESPGIVLPTLGTDIDRPPLTA